MAVTLTVPNELKFELGKGAIDRSSDTFVLVFMESGFVFDPDTDGTYSDISGEEITSAGGYTVGGESLTVDSAWAQDNANDRATMTFVDKVVTPSGAAFDTFCAVCIVDTSHASDVVCACIEFGQNVDVPDGQPFTVKDIRLSSD